MNNPPTLGGAGFLGLLWLGDGAKLPHQTEQIHLEPVLLHLAVHHAVDLDAREGHSLLGRRNAPELAAVGAMEGNTGRDHVPLGEDGLHRAWESWGVSDVARSTGVRFCLRVAVVVRLDPPSNNALVLFCRHRVAPFLLPLVPAGLPSCTEHDAATLSLAQTS